MAGQPPDRFETTFAPLSTTNPARWNESDSAITVAVDVERAGDPLGDGEAAAAEMARALAAWTDVPEGRLDLQIGDDDAQFTATNPSPATKRTAVLASAMRRKRGETPAAPGRPKFSKASGSAVTRHGTIHCA